MIRFASLAAPAALVAALLAAPLAQAELMAEGNIGKFKVFYVLDGKMALASQDGRTLYTFDKDAAGKSTCNDECAKNWPPMLAVAADAPFESFSILTRDDGTKQWAYEGKPLYRSAKDTAPEQANGQGANDAWHIIEIVAHDM